MVFLLCLGFPQFLGFLVLVGLHGFLGCFGFLVSRVSWFSRLLQYSNTHPSHTPLPHRTQAHKSQRTPQPRPIHLCVVYLCRNNVCTACKNTSTRNAQTHCLRTIKNTLVCEISVSAPPHRHVLPRLPSVQLLVCLCRPCSLHTVQNHTHRKNTNTNTKKCLRWRVQFPCQPPVTNMFF